MLPDDPDVWLARRANDGWPRVCSGLGKRAFDRDGLDGGSKRDYIKLTAISRMVTDGVIS